MIILKNISLAWFIRFHICNTFRLFDQPQAQTAQTELEAGGRVVNVRRWSLWLKGDLSN